MRHCPVLPCFSADIRAAAAVEAGAGIVASNWPVPRAPDGGEYRGPYQAIHIITVLGDHTFIHATRQDVYKRQEHAPLPADFLQPSAKAKGIVRELRNAHRFFHWELEFPDVFQGEVPGFDAVIGNPPWEVQKPNSKEFFSDVDPLYRSYGKQRCV